MKENWLDLTSRLSIPLFILTAVFLYYLGTPEVPDPKQTFYLVYPIASIIVCLALYLGFLEIKNWLKSKGNTNTRNDSESWKQFLHTYKPIGQLLLSVLGYVVLLNFLSFIPATIILLFVMFVLFRIGNKWLLFSLPFAITLIIYLVFDKLLNVPLP